jgi:hypothetical protein
MKKVIVTLASGTHNSYLNMSRSRLIEYGEKHNYDVQIITEVLTIDRPPAWSKILLIQKLLKEYDIVLWIDSDAVIIDSSTDILNEINLDKTELALVEHSYAGQSHPNCGVMLFRRTKSILQFLDVVWKQVDLIDHPWWEQAAILRCLGIDSEALPIGPGNISSRPLIEVKFLDKKWNAIRQDYPQDNIKIRHFAGEPHAIRNFLISSLTLDNSTSQEAFQVGMRQIVEFDCAIAERNSVIAERNSVIAELIAEREKVLTSISWKLTKPLRGLHKRFFGKIKKN